jgi:putative ATP-binding cassette transporter
MLIKRAWNLGKDFFFCKEYRRSAVLLLITSIALELSLVYGNVLIAQWYNDFYTSLQNLDKLALYENLKIITIVLIGLVSSFVAKYVFQSLLFIKWRKFMTESYLNKWTKNGVYYGSNLIGHRNDNPDQRISEDLKSFVSLSISLSFGILNNIVTLVSFIAMLWVLSGSLKISVFGFNIEILGYLVWAALIYSVIDTIITYRIGRNLAKVDYLQEKKEANFRFAMMRFRENSESISLYKGEEYEKKIFKSAFEEVVQNFLGIVKINKNLGLWSGMVSQLSGIIPIILAVPRLFAKEINFGGLMQIRLAFSQVQGAFAFFANSITTIAEYKAVVERLTEFNQTIENWQEIYDKSNIKISQNNGNEVILRDLSIRSPVDAILQEKINHTLSPGNSYLITGKNGSGKSTLVKSMGGIWVFGEGEIIFPKDKVRFFVPQHAYMPFGSLMEAIVYPSIKEFDEEHILSLLNEVNLSYLASRLHAQENWAISLSLGEQQKIALLRAIIHKPDILIMDESSSALNPKDEAIIYQFIKKQLPDAIIISVGHHDSLREFHAQEIVFA